MVIDEAHGWPIITLTPENRLFENCVPGISQSQKNSAEHQFPTQMYDATLWLLFGPVMVRDVADMLVTLNVSVAAV